jgi:sorting nexin-8
VSIACSNVFVTDEDSFSSMWHELRVVLHNHENTLLTQAVQAFARDEQIFAESVVHNWASLGDAVGNMPYE